jgi:hypothetical protein
MFVFVGAFAFAYAIYALMTATTSAKPKLRLAPGSPHVTQAETSADPAGIPNFINSDGNIDIS